MPVWDSLNLNAPHTERELSEGCGMIVVNKVGSFADTPEDEKEEFLKALEEAYANVGA